MVQKPFSYAAARVPSLLRFTALIQFTALQQVCGAAAATSVMDLQALSLAYDTAKSFVERQAVRAMLALLPSDWGDAVAATAAALTAHAALVSCMSLLQTQARHCMYVILCLHWL